MLVQDFSSCIRTPGLGLLVYHFSLASLCAPRCFRSDSSTELFLLRSGAAGICFAVSGSSSIYRRPELGPLADRALGAEFFSERFILEFRQARARAFLYLLRPPVVS
jgi:hypothetical protein